MEQTLGVIWLIMLLMATLTVILTLSSVSDSRKKLSRAELEGQQSALNTARLIAAALALVVVVLFAAGLYTSSFGAHLVLLATSVVVWGVGTYFATNGISPSLVLMAKKHYSVS